MVWDQKRNEKVKWSNWLTLRLHLSLHFVFPGLKDFQGRSKEPLSRLVSHFIGHSLSTRSKERNQRGLKKRTCITVHEKIERTLVFSLLNRFMNGEKACDFLGNAFFGDSGEHRSIELVQIHSQFHTEPLFQIRFLLPLFGSRHTQRDWYVSLNTSVSVMYIPMYDLYVSNGIYTGVLVTAHGSTMYEAHIMSMVKHNRSISFTTNYYYFALTWIIRDHGSDQLFLQSFDIKISLFFKSKNMTGL